MSVSHTVKIAKHLYLCRETVTAQSTEDQSMKKSPFDLKTNFILYVLFVCMLYVDLYSYRKRESEGVHAWQIDGCNRNLRVAKVYTYGRLLEFGRMGFGRLDFGWLGCNQRNVQNNPYATLPGRFDNGLVSFLCAYLKNKIFSRRDKTIEEWKESIQQHVLIPQENKTLLKDVCHSFFTRVIECVKVDSGHSE